MELLPALPEIRSLDENEKTVDGHITAGPPLSPGTSPFTTLFEIGLFL